MPIRVALKDGLLSTVDDAETARLLGGRCASCMRYHFPAGDVCPYCATDGCATVPLSTRGVVEVCTTVINRPPGYEGAMPYGFGVVELPEGMRIISRLVDHQRSRPGSAVQLVLETLQTDGDGAEIVTYAFKPLDD